jgi:hypothetical protein
MAPQGHPILLAILYQGAERTIFMSVESTSVVPKSFVSEQKEIKAKWAIHSVFNARW